MIMEGCEYVGDGESFDSILLEGEVDLFGLFRPNDCRE